jgi:undecaprenyl-diphosphatase
LPNVIRQWPERRAEEGGRVVQASRFTLLRRKTVDIHARPLLTRAFLAAVAAALAAVVVLLLFGDPWLFRICGNLPAWCAGIGRILNRFGNGYNIFVPLAVLLALFACTASMKLSRAAHGLITLVAVRVAYLLAATGIPGLVSTLAKWFFGRARPKLSHKFGSLHFEYFTWTMDGIGLSFPSGHTTVAFSAAFALGTLAPPLRVPLFALAALVGAARVVLGAHYPSDVIAGALCGTVVAALVSRQFARQRLGLVVTAEGAIRPKPWPGRSRFAALAATLRRGLRGRLPARALAHTAEPA